MTWLIILVVLAAAFAPVAYMMPTKRERALTDLRMLARREGLEVDVTQLPKLAALPHERVSAGGKTRDPRIDCVSYGRRLNKAQIVPVRYRLLRAAGTEYPIIPGSAWELDRHFKAATRPVPAPDYWQFLGEIEPLLPKDVLGLAVTDDFVLLYWLERLSAETRPPAQGPEVTDIGVSNVGGARDSAALVADIRILLNKVAEFHGVYFAPPAPDVEPH